MFTDGYTPSIPFNFSAVSSTEREARHLVNRLRLEFRTASQRQLEAAVAAAVTSTASSSPEKVLQGARVSLSELLTPAADRAPTDSAPSEPPFRVIVA